jgi:Protein of unknown function (DUF2752)
MQIEEQITNYALSPLAERLSAAAGAAAIGGGSAFVALVDPATHSFFPVCPLYAITGFACPGCGLTRGFHSLFQGDVLTALDFNALIPVWAVIFLYVFVSLTLLAVRGRGLPVQLTAPRFLWTFMIVLLAFGVLRNLPFYPFSVLFP